MHYLNDNDSIGEAVCKRAEALNAAAVVMAKHQRGKVAEFFLGSGEQGVFACSCVCAGGGGVKLAEFFLGSGEERVHPFGGVEEGRAGAPQPLARPPLTRRPAPPSPPLRAVTKYCTHHCSQPLVVLH